MNRKPEEHLNNDSALVHLLKNFEAEETIKEIPTHKFGSLVMVKIPSKGHY